MPENAERGCKNHAAAPAAVPAAEPPAQHAARPAGRCCAYAVAGRPRPACISWLACWIWLFAFLPGCGTGRDGDPEDHARVKVLVLGMDGLDPVLVRQLMDEGRLPNLARLAAMGSFRPLETSMPPQSPVAWSNFISGATPAVHQIWDFIHRKVPRVRPFLSTSEVIAPENADAGWTFGRWRIPTESARVENYRRGPAFWDYLVAAGVDTTIYRMPAAYPPPPKVKGRGEFRCLCGMGTPDLLGGYGEFSCYREDEKSAVRPVAGGVFYRLDVVNHRATARLRGMDNFLRRNLPNDPVPKLEHVFEIVRDPEQPAAKIHIGGQTIILRQGEWSDWIPVTFDTGIPAGALLQAAIPTSATGIVRLYLKQVHPKLWLYVSPVNIDPLSPFNPISTPPEFAAELARDTGRYYTTGIPEDTKALRADAIDEQEFLSLVRGLVEERFRQYEQALAEFKSGFLFFYFGHTDQLAHIFWRDRDPGHPGRVPEQDGLYQTVIEDTYVEMDAKVGDALKVIDDNDVLIVMSDHGFASFRRGFNVNTWLIQNGYMALTSNTSRARREGLAGGYVDWSATRAYALGINCLYLNLQGREERGIVPPSQRSALLHEIGDKLLAVRDVDGSQVIEKVYYVSEEFPGSESDVSPDMLLGFARNYRGSWATTLGGAPLALIEDNKDRWSGDHCIAHYLVPGTIVTNRRITVDDPALTDLAPSILALFGIDRPDPMIGRVILEMPPRPQEGG